MATRKAARRPAAERVPALELPVLEPAAAGIDLGATELCAAVAPERGSPSIRTFGTFTAELQELAAWLRQCEIRTVAIEATGVFWVPVLQILETAGFEVCLVNPRHLQNVRGRKTDVVDAQWLQHLHAVGLLQPSFRPPEAICALRTLWRQREHLVRAAAEQIQLMQKSLTQMNLHLHHVLADLAGKTGLQIVDAILRGDRDPQTLARLRDPRVQSDEATLAAALTGDWRPEHLFTLRQARQTFQHYQDLLQACDAELEAWLQSHPSVPRAPSAGGAGGAGGAATADALPPSARPSAPKAARKTSRNAVALPTLDLRQELAQRFGVDLVAVPALGLTSVAALYAELGSDLKAFPRLKQFTSWLALCPDPRKTGGKVVASHTRNVQHRVARIFRQAAQTLARSDCHLGRFYRRIRGKLGGPQAVTAAAHKLARIFYHLVTTQEAYDESVFQREDAQYQARRLAAVHRQAKSLGYSLTPCEVS